MSPSLTQPRNSSHPIGLRRQKSFLPQYIEKDDLWTATNVHIMVIMYNKKLVSEQEKPQTWADLFNPKWKGKMVMANPEKSGSAYAKVYGIYKLYGWDGLKKLIANAKILDSASLIWKGTAEGEYPLGLTIEYAAYRYIAGGSKDVGHHLSTGWRLCRSRRNSDVQKLQAP